MLDRVSVLTSIEGGDGGRGKRGEVIRLIHTLNGAAARRPQECSGNGVGSAGEGGCLNEDLLEGAPTVRHTVIALSARVLNAHSSPHTHTSASFFLLLPFLSFPP